MVSGKRLLMVVRSNTITVPQSLGTMKEMSWQDSPVKLCEKIQHCGQ
jgi:hypothetical protein